MGQPHRKVPRVAVNVALVVADNRYFHVGVAVRRRDLRYHRLRDCDRRLAVVAARDAYQTVLEQIHGNRNVFQRAEIFLQLTRLIRQRIVYQRKAFFRNVNRRLEGKVANAQTHGEEIVIGFVAVPEQRRSPVQRATLFRAQGAVAQGLRVLLVELFDFVAHTDKVLAVALKAAVFRLTPRLSRVTHARHRPYRANDRRRQRDNHAGVHRHRRAGTVSDNRKRASQNHGNRHR